MTSSTGASASVPPTSPESPVSRSFPLAFCSALVCLACAGIGGPASVLPPTAAPPEDAPTPGSPEASVAERYPGYTIAKRCDLGFSRPDQLAVGIVGDSDVRYLVLGEKKIFEITTGAHHEPDLSCFTAEEARAFNAVIDENEGTSGSIDVSGKRDVLCVTSDETTFACHQFIDGRIVSAGGWSL